MTPEAPPSDAAIAREEQERLVLQLLGVSTLMKGRISALLGELQLTHGMAAALWSTEPEGTSLMELSTRLHCDRSNATLISERLETAGLARRTIDPNDRRIRILTLTVAGLRARQRLFSSIGVASGIDKLSARERTQLSRLLAKVSTSV